MKHKQHKKMSVKWRIFIILVLFTLILLFLVWFFQIANLNNFYKRIKKQELKNAASELFTDYGQEEFRHLAHRISEDYDISINVVNKNGISVFKTQMADNSHINILPDEFQELYSMVESAGGTVMIEVNGRYRENESDILPPEIGHFPEERPLNGNAMHMKERGNVAKSMVYIRLVVDEEGNHYMILMNSLITPVDATVNTLRIQFIYIAAIFIVLAVIIAFVLSRSISHPIVKINDSAKQLADGDFEPRFEGKGYKEVYELANTLNYAATELGKSERLQRELLANVTHDLRTPLTMITAYSEVMRDLPGENTPENAQVIIDESRRLTTLVNDMLDLSKLQAGVSELKREKFDFTASILEVMNRFSKLTEQQGYKIYFEYRDNVMVYADEYKVHQVVYNLINNAINYAGEDKVVEVKQIIRGNIVRLEVTDHGAGIAPEELDNIWDRYYKIDKAHKRAVQGSGIGLSIVQNIMKLHNEKYGVNSQVGVGSTFWFELKIMENE